MPGLNSGLLAPVYEMETITIKVPYIIDELSARAIAKVIFQPENRADYESLLTGMRSSLTSAILFTCSGDIGLRGQYSRSGDLIVAVDHYYASPDNTTCDLADMKGLVVKMVAILLSAGSRPSSDCNVAGCASGNTQLLYRLIGPCKLATYELVS
jgi:hypothetical protein